MNTKRMALENAEALSTSANVLRFYKDADLLTVSLPDYFNHKAGIVVSGRGIGLDLAALRRNPDQLRRLIEILSGYLKK